MPDPWVWRVARGERYELTYRIDTTVYRLILMRYVMPYATDMTAV